MWQARLSSIHSLPSSRDVSVEDHPRAVYCHGLYLVALARTLPPLPIHHPLVFSKTLSENLSMRLEERRTSPRMGLSMYPFSKEMRPLREPNTTKKSVDYFRLPRSLWRKLKKCLPNKRNNTRPGGRPRASDRAVMDAIWYVLWSGCQWKAVHRDWFGVSSSVIHERFQRWTKMGLFEKLMKRVVEYSS
jgi:hypothetical protein